MSHLFDISPVDSGQSKRRSKRPRRAQGGPKPADPVSTAGYSIVAIGRVDDLYECAGGCGSWVHDILDDDFCEWRIECVVCGTRQLVPAGHREQSDGDFVMKGGRFDGLTLFEISVRKYGLEFLNWAAVSHPRAAVQSAVKLWLTKRRQVN
jgi:hypothetical protein